MTDVGLMSAGLGKELRRWGDISTLATPRLRAGISVKGIARANFRDGGTNPAGVRIFRVHSLFFTSSFFLLPGFD